MTSELHSPAYTFAAYLALAQAADTAFDRGDHDRAEELGVEELDALQGLASMVATTEDQAIDKLKAASREAIHVDGAERNRIESAIALALAEIDAKALDGSTIAALRRAALLASIARAEVLAALIESALRWFAPKGFALMSVEPTDH